MSDPTGISYILGNREVQLQLRKAWQLSFIGRKLFQERGGWIYAHPNHPSRIKAILAHKDRSRPFRPGADAAIDLNNPRSAGIGYVVIANFHTHPGLSADGYNSEPSHADFVNSYLRGVPGIVIGHDGLYTYGPQEDYPEPGLQVAERDKHNKLWRKITTL